MPNTKSGHNKQKARLLFQHNNYYINIDKRNIQICKDKYNVHSFEDSIFLRL